MLSKYITATLLFVVHLFQTCLCTVLEEKLKQFDIVPKFFPVAPLENLTVIYPFGEIHPGDILKYEQVIECPTVKWNAKEDEWYCLYTAGLSKWSFGMDHEWADWVQFNIPGDKFENGTTMYEYRAMIVDPKQHTGKFYDRYAFFIFKQQGGKIDIETMKDYTKGYYKFQEIFTMVDFCKEYNLGNPIAGNFFAIAR